MPKRMPDEPLHILQVCFRMPYPLNDGGAIAMYNIAKGLYNSGCKLTMLVPVTAKHNISHDDLPSELKDMADIHLVKINTDITIWGAFLNLFSSEPYYLSRYNDPVFRQKLIDILKSGQFDIVQIESLKMAGYLKTIRENSDAKVVIRSHNIEFRIWQRLEESIKNVIKKLFLKIEISRIKKQELESLNDFDAIVPITDLDGSYFISEGCTKPVFPTPSGYDISDFKPEQNIEQGSIFHIGALDWMPNLQALKWFLKECWPIIHEKYPEVKFYIAGKNMPEEIKKIKTDNVIISGEVSNAAEFIKSKQIMVVPLQSGSGLRIKIIEGMALAKIIISTSIGAEGIGYSENENILIADTAEKFVNNIGRVLNDEKFALQISSNAFNFVKENYDNLIISKRLLSNYRTLLA